MGIAWGLGQFAPAFQQRLSELRRPRHDAASRPASRSPATPAGSAGDCFTPNSPTTIGVTIAPGETAGGDGVCSYAARRRNLACRPPALAGPHGAHESLPHDGA